jgi:hypothetical protein
MGTGVFAVIADEIQQFDVGLAALAQRRVAQLRAEALVLQRL